MKNIMLVFVFVLSSSYNGYSQDVNNSVITEKDFSKKENRIVAYDLKRQMLNGDGKLQDVIINVGCEDSIFNSIGVDKINKMLITANEKAPSTIENKFTYSSKTIKLSQSKKVGEFWHMTIEYTSQNKYGALTNGLISAEFTLDGEFKNIKNFF